MEVRRGIYFIRQADSPGVTPDTHYPGVGPIKIGWSSGIDTRLAEIQRMCPVQLVLLGIIEEATMAFERELHTRFRHLRLHGEWFEPSVELLTLATGHNDRFLRLVTSSQAAEILGVSEAFVTKELAPLSVAAGPRGGSRLLEDDLDELAKRVVAEKVRRAVRLGLKAAQSQIAQIAEEAALSVAVEIGRTIAPTPTVSPTPLPRDLGPTCLGTNGRGEPCKSRTQGESDYCVFHEPARATA